MRKVKITERIVLGLMGAVVLIAVILFSINTSHTNPTATDQVALQKASNEKVQADAGSTDSSKAELSIDTKDYQMVYQTRGNTNQTEINEHRLSDSSTGQAGKAPQESQSGTKTGQAANKGHSGQQTDTTKDITIELHGSGISNKQNSQDSQTKSDGGQADTSSSSSSKNTKKGQDKADNPSGTNQAKANTSSAASQSKANTSSTTSQSKANSQAGANQEKAGGTDSSRSYGQVSGQASLSASKQDNTFHTVPETYFSDAVFIGDSRTVGMQQSGLLADATYYAKTGIGIGEILTKRFINEGGVMLSVEEALARHTFGKVYIMAGINDMARGDTSWFIQQYKKILAVVQRTQPDAVVYIQGNIPMSYQTQDLNGTLNNQNLSQRNEASRTLADSETIFYLDIGYIYTDRYGHLDSAYTRDGLHIKSEYYTLWADYLMHHAIVHE